MVPAGPAAQRWAAQLEAWAIPAEILEAAPESPWGFCPELFQAPEEPRDSPSRSRALEALPPGGSVLDVGAGAGAAGLALVPPAGALAAVDQSEQMLGALGQDAARRGVPVAAFAGRWPDVAGSVPPADVVVCHHVLYNVADAGPFLVALADHARRRVVVELTARHPLVGLNPLWRHFHGLDRPDGPGLEEAVAVMEEVVGVAPSVERFDRPSRWRDGSRPLQVAFVRRRLCLPATADPEIDELLDPDRHLAHVQAACLWWDR